ncbi:GNAT family N-acetyltransferase [Anaerococcus vaginalis]|uniref:GNAT family N-acetyltransferase n=1 Tax=Anaerococcus vaginalis TaxID=33037 RepID=UPI00242B289E|nr:GNAT family protein [Anaerococcus vaginalis]MDD7766936.1 GNAT family protein [Anaerococcus vaginalis]
MCEFEDVKIRKFEFNDINKKIEWINNPKNNEFLHYDLPLEYEKTCKWFEKNKDKKNRYDAIIEYKGTPVGIIGLLNIDYKNKKCEEYITIGNTSLKRKGIGTKALNLICLYAFKILKLNKVTAYVEYGNPSLYLHTKVGFEIEGFLKNDLIVDGKSVDRFVLGLFEKNLHFIEKTSLVKD